jgi:hypothetical protein
MIVSEYDKRLIRSTRERSKMASTIVFVFRRHLGRKENSAEYAVIDNDDQRK